jgi:hypothetical protein
VAGALRGAAGANHALTAQLVNRNDEELRGRIKALQELQNMPETLRQEREGITAGLADNAPAL